MAHGVQCASWDPTVGQRLHSWKSTGAKLTSLNWLKKIADLNGKDIFTACLRINPNVADDAPRMGIPALCSKKVETER